MGFQFALTHTYPTRCCIALVLYHCSVFDMPQSRRCIALTLYYSVSVSPCSMAEVQTYSEIQRVREALRDSPKSSDSKPAMNKSSENPFFQHAGIHLIIFGSLCSYRSVRVLVLVAPLWLCLCFYIYESSSEDAPVPTHAHAHAHAHAHTRTCIRTRIRTRTWTCTCILTRTMLLRIPCWRSPRHLWKLVCW